MFNKVILLQAFFFLSFLSFTSTSTKNILCIHHQFLNLMILFTNKRFFIVIPTTHILTPLISKLNFQIEQFSINHDEQYISLIISFAKKKKKFLIEIPLHTFYCILISKSNCKIEQIPNFSTMNHHEQYINS